jgi:hypothetical protein
LIFFNKNTQLMPHLIQFISTKHIYLTSFFHKNSQLSSITKDFIIVLELHSCDFFFIYFHENPILDDIICQIHSCLSFIPLRTLKKSSSWFLTYLNWLFSFLLHPQLVLELCPLILFLKVCLNSKKINASLIENCN